MPTGYLICNGSAISRTTYAALFDAIGTTWGTGDGSTTFNLPNLIDRVAWGASTVGTYKNAGLPNISGTLGGIGTNNTEANYSGFEKYSGVFTKKSDSSYAGNMQGSKTPTDNAAYEVNFNASSSNSIYGKSSTVQPPAATLIPIIKY